MLKDRTYTLYSGDKIIGEFKLLSSQDKYSVKLIDGLQRVEVPIDFNPEYFKEGRRF